MKFQYILIVLLFVFACSNPKSEQEVESPASPPKTVNKNSTTNALLKKIMGNGEGLLRGFNFGDDITAVKKNEKLELFEQEPTHIGYTFDTPDLETVDILYGKDPKGKLNSIQLDIYMNSDESNEELYKAFSDYFSLKFGKMTEVGGNAAWNLTPKGILTVKKVKTNLDRGLEVKFMQDSPQAL